MSLTNETESLDLESALALMDKGLSPVADEYEDEEITEVPQGTEEDIPDEEPGDDGDELAEDDAEADSENPIIEPPKSFTSEERAEFSKLPPEMQQAVARREADRDKAVLQRMNQVATERQQIEADIQRFNQVQQQYQQAFILAQNTVLPELQQLEQVDWNRLSIEDPARWTELKQLKENLQGRYQHIAQLYEQNVQYQQAQAIQAYQSRCAHEAELVKDQMPEFRDPETAKALLTDINSTMAEYGFTTEEWGTVADGRVFRVITRLAQLEKAEQSRKSALAKKSNPPAPRMLTPNAVPTRGDNKNRAVKQLEAKLSKSGSIMDALQLMNMRN